MKLSKDQLDVLANSVYNKIEELPRNEVYWRYLH